MTHFPLHPYPWQLPEWQQLNQQIKANKLPHAVMLAGPRGIGKRHLAESLAQLLLCATPVEGTPCGNCRDCQLNRVQNHPDLIRLEPEEGSKGIKVDQVRALIEDLGKTSQQGGYKVVVLEPAEAMNTNAANALLKSLEEPAAKTLLVLVSHAVNSVLPTIRSRCQMRLLPMPNSEQVIHWLTPLLAGSPLPIEKLMDAASGAPLTALAYLKGDALERRDTWLLQLIRLSSGQASAIEVAGQWYKDDVVAIVEWFLSWLHSLMRWQVGMQNVLISQLPQDMRDRLSQLPAALLHRYVEKLLLAKRQLLSSANPNKQLLLEEALLDWGALLRAGARPQGKR
ncbi:MAG TPA: DNA polymerase III subunit delta' [Cellvibrio sp.]|nr:DNA polymerase III subunit delta' [Cellvibrio sp.]